jgi:glutaredoxin-like YruB-family protein
MEFKVIKSYEDLQSDLNLHPHQYLLLYKNNSENSNCAIENLSQVENVKIDFLKADVSKVKDIHSKYNITTVPALLEFNNQKLKNVVKGCQTSEYYETILNQDGFLGETNKAQTKRVKVYSTPTCPWCTRVKEYLRSQNIRFTDVDVSKDQSAADRMVAKSGQRGVPQTEINGRMIVGFDKSKIDLLLDIK